MQGRKSTSVQKRKPILQATVLELVEHVNVLQLDHLAVKSDSNLMGLFTK
jgi:hypothetical protein